MPLKIYLIHNLFSRLFNRLVINLHLLGKVFLKPFILVDLVLNELYGYLNVYFHCRFTVGTIVEPGLRPPFQAGAVWVHADDTWYVETLYIEIQVG